MMAIRDRAWIDSGATTTGVSKNSLGQISKGAAAWGDKWKPPAKPVSIFPERGRALRAECLDAAALRERSADRCKDTGLGRMLFVPGGPVFPMD